MPSNEHVALQRNGHHTDLPNSASSRDAHPHSERGQGDQIRSTSIGEFTAKDRIPAQQRTGSAQRPHARSLVADDQLCALARTVASQPRLRISLTSTLSGTVPHFRPYDTHQDDMLDAAVLRDHLNSQQGSSVGVDAVEEGDGLSLVSSSRRLSAQRLSNAMDLSQLHNSINEELLHISGSSSAFSTFLDRDQSVKSISDTALYIGQPPSTRERRLHRREQQDGRVAEESLAEPLPRNFDDDDKSDESRRTEPPLDTSPSPSPEPTNADKNQSVIVEVFQEKRQNYQPSRETEGLVAPQCSSPEFVPKMGLLDHLPSPSRSAPEYPLVASSSSNITLEPVVGTQSGNPASRSCLRGAQTTAREEEVEVSPPPREAKLKLKRPKKKDLSTAERVARRRKKEKRRRKRLRREAALAAAQKESIGEVAPPHHLGSTTVMEDPENASDTHASKTGELKRQPSKFVEGLRSHTGRVHAASTPPLVTLVDGGVRRANSIPSPVPPVSPHIDSPVSGSQPFRNRAFGLESSAGDNPNDCDEQEEEISNEQTRAAVSDSAPPSQRTCESGVGGPRKAKETEEVGSDPSLKEDCHHSVSYSSRRLPSESASSARGQTSVRQQDPPDSSSRRDAGSYGSSTSNSPQASTLSARQVSGRVVAGSAAAAVAELRRSAGHSNGPFSGQTQGRSVGRRRSGSQLSCCSSCEGSRSVNSPTSIERSPGFPSCPSDSTSGSRSRSNSVGLPQGSRSGSSSRSGFSRSSFTASGSETYSSSTSSSGESVLMDEAIPLKEGCSIPPPALAFTDVAFRISHQHLLAPYAEYAIIHEWNITEGLWGRVETNVVLSPSAFSKGNMRASYHMIDLTRLSCSVVAKRYLKASVEDEQYFDDVSMHSIAGHWARLYNSQKPPKNVKFVPAAVLVLPNRQPPLILAMEPKLDGTFQKYNNNSGYVPPNARWTPQAFSHFTYHYSHRDLMIVDIQGVEDIYTDPQILSPDGEGYGRGNLGFKGMRRFMRSHKCNPVCRALGLPPLGGDREFSRSTTDAAKPMRALKGTAQIEMEKLPPKIYHHTSGNSSSSTIPPYNGSRTEVLDSRPHHVVPPTSTSPFPSLRAQSPVIGTPKLNQPFFTASGSSHVEPASRFLQRFHAVWKDQVNYFSTQATGGGMFGEQPHLSSSPARVMHSYGSNNALSTDGSVGNTMSPVLSIPTPHAMPIIFSSNSPQLQRYQRGSSQVSVSYGSSEASTPRMSGVGGNGNASMMMPRPPTNAALATSNGRGSISRIAQQHSVPAFSAVEEQACARRNVQRK